ncbi:PstS family phosphate ABC transporter substrate-binding protein [Undibacterium sp. CY18W]|uniref:Phosphate-binding protein n=1 Tax=Undibacterium hunanense TaxID=2762292 RepID=A0ABR6ZUL0_9BURK|nr:PstS family phosphate ABC transporter substrate-binding protein [Undibacterium hunanense]MBC3919215.1 PstS family phosphate ABC transporter substrate-binding protein [Undibacterium hunanense]
MKNFRFDYLTSLVILTLTTGVAMPASAQTFIKIDGSSTVFPITEAVADDYQASKGGAVKVTIGIAGTGGGFKKFCKGETDISDASRPILKKEMEECAKNGIKYMELPIAFDALTVVVNPKNKFLSKITVEELKKMWEPAAQGTIMRWKQINPAWPDTPIKLFGAGADSGTFDYFTDAIVGKTKSSRTDYVASEDDNVVVQGVARDPNSIGYFGYAYYVENSKKLKLVPIVHQAGKPAVAPSVQSVVDGSYQPLSRPIFIYVSAKAAERPEVKGFVDFYLANAQKSVKEAKYIPLTDKDYKHAMLNFNSKKTGTAFGGEPEIGVKIADLLRRDPKE